MLTTVPIQFKTQARKTRQQKPNNLDQITALEEVFIKKALRLSMTQTESLRIQLSRGAQPQSLILDIGIVGKLAIALADLISSVYDLGASAARLEIKKAKAQRVGFAVAIEAVSEQEFFPSVGINWYRNYALRLAGVQQQNALVRVKSIISQAIIDGESHQDVIKSLDAVFVDMGKSRLENIARTETAKIYEQARYQEFEGEDSVIGYQISAIVDERTTDVCKHRNGKIIPKNKINGWLPPYHYQCRTTILPVFKWENPKFNKLDGPEPIDGFGSSSMAIPEIKDKVTNKLIERTAKNIKIVPSNSINTKSQVQDDILKDTFQGLPEDKRQAVILSMKDAPESIRKLVLKYANKVKYINRECDGGRYAPSISEYGAIRIKFASNSNGFIYTHNHEYGHFLDYCIFKTKNGYNYMTEGISEKQMALAIRADAKLLKIPKTKTAIINMLRKPKYKEHKNAYVGDLFDAVYEGEYDNVIRSWWGHPKEYWRKIGTRQTEIFANIFEIYSTNQRELIITIEKYLPETIKIFWGIINGEV